MTKEELAEAFAAQQKATAEMIEAQLAPVLTQVNALTEKVNAESNAEVEEMRKAIAPLVTEVVANSMAADQVRVVYANQKKAPNVTIGNSATPDNQTITFVPAE